MGTVTTLGIAGMVVAFLVSVLGSFPGANGASQSAESGLIEDGTFTVEAVNKAGNMLSQRYVSLIDEMVSFQTDPDCRRAELAREEMARAATTITGMFGDFRDGLQGELNDLTAQAGTP